MPLEFVDAAYRYVILRFAAVTGRTYSVIPCRSFLISSASAQYRVSASKRRSVHPDYMNK
jgi:hypothetical protein